MKLFLKTFSIMLLAFLLLCPGAFGSPVIVLNESFENPSIAAGDWSTVVPLGWAGSSDFIGGVWYPTKYFPKLCKLIIVKLSFFYTCL